MKRTHIQSSVLRSYGYDRESKIFEVKLISGEVYQYQDVPLELYGWFLKAKAKGVYYNTVIKPGRKFIKIDEN